MVLYRRLLRLLPRRRRERYGSEMAIVFEEHRDATRRESGALAAGWLWTREAIGMLKFAMARRGRAAAMPLAGAGTVWFGRGPGLRTEVR